MDPLEAATNPLAAAQVEPAPPSLSAANEARPARSPRLSPVARPKSNVDLRFLQNPRIYHSLPTEDAALPLLGSEQQPSPDTPLPALLRGSHLRRAAEIAARDLLRCSPSDAEAIFQLLYTRLACLVLIARPDLAAQEAAPLTDLLARNPPGSAGIVALILWELRLLLVRLQSLSSDDGGRRGVMALYGLAGEARAHLKQAHMDEDEREYALWSERLRDLGLRVADALVEMGELETAERHLDSLTDVDLDEVTYRKAMLRIHVGDVFGAEHYLEKLGSGNKKATLEILLKMADGQDATSSWQDLLRHHPDDGMMANNFAVSSLYAGNIMDARRILERTLSRSPASAGILFNINTIYELCSERAIDHRVDLANPLRHEGG
ncbi:hypothetical protein LTR35_003385 [Friedmanniomyces endolithicus]|uniref:Trafficking protein particle complex subunit 12 n=1 Tax=Friedmanniomyces endolithicus TaxID=329885 RepID=A0A4V5N711_9PEZI|nr:hypothetical protein LTS09_003360 [Friedmanniomyces endolithicus]KAK0288983.1 hypothetical protein LTR35_003385 [Friedmanniomyces endolithicus]KAK0293180.1 hypothetical protein LTS00_007783 [Friedmanniomyces endolithicus]KAK0319515.1 hypothetical protein LTR82_009582 [Friedmanniomyces endolithicus]KAK0823795.1 hypothetical protein LTR73_008261 [Friedmanniomyces endolithicus]